LEDTRKRLEERNEIAQSFENVAQHLADLDFEEVWGKATERER